MAFFTWYPSDIYVNWYTINPRETIHVEYTWKCTPIIHMRKASWITREKKIRLKLYLISTCKSTLIIHMNKFMWNTLGFLVEHVSINFPPQLHVNSTWCACWEAIEHWTEQCAHWEVYIWKKLVGFFPTNSKLLLNYFMSFRSRSYRLVKSILFIMYSNSPPPPISPYNDITLN